MHVQSLRSTQHFSYVIARVLAVCETSAPASGSGMVEFGTVAAVPQLVDVVLRAGRQVRDFLDAHKDNRTDIKAF